MKRSEKKSEPIQPPAWAERLLSWYCKPELLEDLQGDLNEYFHRNVEKKGKRSARLIYIFDVIKFFRLYTVRKPEFLNLFIQWIMLGSYIKTSGRSILRNKLFSAINIIGLSVSMSVGLLMIGIVSDIYSYDKFHTHHDRIYRITSHYGYMGNPDGNKNASNSMMVGKAMQENFPEVEKAAILHSGFGGDFQYGEKMLPLNGLWSNESLFDVFSFKLLQGNAATALKQPFSVILTEESAQKIFGAENALGKTLTLNKDRQYTVTGIMENIPVFSHMKFDALGSMSTREIIVADNREWQWDNIWSTYVYVLLQEGADLQAFQQKLNKYASEHDNEVPNTKVELGYQSIDDIIAGDDLNNQLGPTFGKIMLRVFTGITAIVLLSACFNYTNLSIARSLRRSKEVGVRKIIGAFKGHIVGQFVVEAVLIALIALLFSFVLFLLLKPHLLTLHQDLKELLVLELSTVQLIYFIVFALTVGILAGILPAIFFSKINALKVLKDASGMRVFSKVALRKVLIVFQYSISIIFITSTLICYKQYKHYLAFNLGYDTENIVNIRLLGNTPDVLKQELSALPEIKNISHSRIVTSTGNYWGTYMKTEKDPLDSSIVWHNFVDENYIPLHRHTLLAGRNFLYKPDSVKETEIIVNQEVLKLFHLASQVPADAIGEVVRINNNQKVTIIGVVQDFSYGKADNSNSKGVILRYGKDRDGYLNVKLATSDWSSVRPKVDAIWKKIDPIHPLEAKLFSDQLKESFNGISASVKLAGLISTLAICIASLGLLGMVIFTTETRLREISIRKVLGASEGKLIFLLGRGFFILLGVAASIALPLTYFFFNQFLLVQMGNHLPIAAFEMLVGVAGIFAIAVIMIGSQTFKVARTNPAEVLKNE